MDLNPNSRKTRACHIVATVKYFAPNFICSAASCGDMCVFTCGASSKPISSQYLDIAEILFARALCRNVAIGVVKFPSNKEGASAINSLKVLPILFLENPLYVKSTCSWWISEIFMFSDLFLLDAHSQSI